MFTLSRRGHLPAADGAVARVLAQSDLHQDEREANQHREQQIRHQEGP